MAFDVENDGSIGGSKSFTHAHLYGYYWSREQYRVEIKGKSRKKDRYVKKLWDKHYTDRNELMKDLLAFKKSKKHRIPFTLVGFNTDYDYTFIQDICNDHDKHVNGSRFIMGKIKNGIRIMDISNHYTQGSLENAMHFFNMDERWGIRKLSLDESEIAERNRFDAMATYHLADEFRKMYNGFNSELRLTAPSNSLEIFTNSFMPDNFAVHREDMAINDFERESYIGGRTEMFARGKLNVLSYDVHSMYPSVMRDELYPDPMSVRHFKEPSEEFWKKWYYDPEHYLGIYRVTVEAPEINYPVLGIRYKTDQYEKLIFPTGTFSGVFTSEELRYAEECGYKILNCTEFIVYRNKIPLFRNFVNEFWSMRTVYKEQENAPMEKFCKLIMNSLYGKFGEHHYEDGFSGKEEDFPWEEIDMNTFDKRVIRATIDGVDYLRIPANRTADDTSHTIPCLSSFVTSYSRLKLIKAIHAAERGGLISVYVDTDSIKFTRPDGSLPDKEYVDSIINADDSELGKFGYEYAKRQYFQTQKVYCGLIEDDIPDQSSITAKGMNRKDEHGNRIPITISGDLNDPDSVVWSARFMRPIKEGQSIIRGLPKALWIEDGSVIKGHGNKRAWDGQFSRPIRL